MPHKVIFLDTETTSANKDRCGVFQIAGIIDINGETAEQFDIRSNIFPEDLVEEEAFISNGCSLDKLNAYPTPREAFNSFREILRKYVNQYDKKDKFIAIAYVADFDNTVLRNFFLKNGCEFFGSFFWHPWIDVMNLAAYVYQDRRNELENFKMATVAKFLGIGVDQNKCHDAYYDVEIARKMYYSLI
jgi:DNA polymerase III subunit epsilon